MLLCPLPRISLSSSDQHVQSLKPLKDVMEREEEAEGRTGRMMDDGSSFRKLGTVSR